MSAKNYDHTNFGCGDDPDYDEDDKSLGRNVGGDRSWSHPVYATDGNGDPVTVSFGQGNREGETLIAKGHVEYDDFYERDKNKRSIGHEHADGKGNITNRGKY